MKDKTPEELEREELERIQVFFFVIALTLIIFALGILTGWGWAFLTLGVYLMYRVYALRKGNKPHKDGTTVDDTTNTNKQP